jgi:LysM repeat protein
VDDHDSSYESLLGQVTQTSAKSNGGASRSVWYTVRAGDTLGKIAARFNTTVERLKSLNHLTSTQLAIGKKLMVSNADSPKPLPISQTK